MLLDLGISNGDDELNNGKNLRSTPPGPTEDARAIAEEMIEMSRALEALASRTAEYIESTVFVFAKELRDRAQAHLAAPSAPADNDHD